MAYQSLYRRYRPQKFAEIKGQDHVVRALQTAVRESKVGHAYLLHGPRGSGKTSTARVLAKALNCTELDDDGEPCCTCESCVSIQEGRSFDLQELDAASNNKVDDMRGLLERVNLASPGQAKVYLLDEVHMLTAGAENALLKTLEEPPPHVTWVLATTEPHKVVQTIRSRCQVFELGLIGADIMADHIRYVVADAELDVDGGAIDQAVSDGGGSVRDTLTALERIVAGGGTTELDSSTDAVLAALADHDRAAALSAVGDAVGRGRDPRTFGEMVLAGLRDAFLTVMGDPPDRMSERERDRAADLAERMAPAALTRALETLGRALIDMRQAPDPRVDIEVALMRLCQPDEDRSLEALAQRVRQLEARLDGSAVPAAAGSAPPPAAPAPAAAPASRPSEPRAPASSPPPSPGPTKPGSTGPASSPAPDRRPAAASAETTSPPAARSASTGRPAEAARRALAEHRSAAATRRETASSPAPSPAAPPPVPPPVPVPDLASMQPMSPTDVVNWARSHLGLAKEFVVARATELEPDQMRRREPVQLQALWKDLLTHAAVATPEADSPAPESPATTAEATEAAAAGAGSTDPSPAEAAPAGAAPASEASPPESGRAAVASGAQEPMPVAVQTGHDQPAAHAETPGAAPAEADDIDHYLAELDDSAEAPSHAHDIEQKIRAVFPGTEFVDLPDPEEDEAG